MILTPAGEHLIAHLMNVYSLGFDTYLALVEEQGGRCAICDALPENGERLCVDHDHHTREVRALLCGRCNTALGLMGERVDLIERLAQYAAEAEERRDEWRRHPRSVLGVPRRAGHPLTRVFERVPNKTACAQSILAVVDCWRRDRPQRSLPLVVEVEEYWPAGGRR
jgi:hypothetical protein